MCVDTGDSASSAGTTIFTATGGLLGTPGYMCPNYCSSRKYGPRSDLFSVGIVILELLTGKVRKTARVYSER